MAELATSWHERHRYGSALHVIEALSGTCIPRGLDMWFIPHLSVEVMMEADTKLPGLQTLRAFNATVVVPEVTWHLYSKRQATIW